MPSGDKARLAVFASGTGSNANVICHYFKAHADISVNLIITNRKHAGVRDVARSHLIDCICIPAGDWQQPENVIPYLEAKEITHIALAGFLLLLPSWLIMEYKGRIINIHPALLPKYGGKGMYGIHVHEKVIASGDDVSGLTIHEVNENYDEGSILFQQRIDVLPGDSATSLANRILQSEHYHYPRVIEHWIQHQGR